MKRIDLRQKSIEKKSLALTNTTKQKCKGKIP